MGLTEIFESLNNSKVQRAAVITDPKLKDNPIIFATKKFYELTEYEPSEVIGHNCRFLQGEETDPKTIEYISKSLAKCEITECNILNYTKTGKPIKIHLIIKPLFDDNGHLNAFVSLQTLVH